MVKVVRIIFLEISSHPPPSLKKQNQIYVLNFGRSSIKKMYRANLFFRKNVSNKKGKVKSVIFTVFSLGI